MEKLMQIAKKNADHVLIRNIKEEMTNVSFENGELKNIETSIASNIALTLIKDGKIGFAYTTNLIDREQFVKNALTSLKGGVDGSYGISNSGDPVKLNSYDKSIENIGTSQLVDEAKRTIDYLKTKTDGQVNLEQGMVKEEIRILNSNGVDYSQKNSSYFLYPMVLYPGSYSSVMRAFASKSLKNTDQNILDLLLNLYNSSNKQVCPPGGQMKVLFLPEAFYTIAWRMISALSSENAYYNISPIKDKIGSKIFSSMITAYDNPIDDTMPGSRSFDDEGTVTSKVMLIENGVLQSFYFDRKTAKKMGTKSTGNGYCREISRLPKPDVRNFTIEAGALTIEQMIKSIDKGVIVPSVLGAHSGNIPNGDFSVGLSPGIYVENGEIVGHVNDSMVAGNIYDVLNKVIAIENEKHLASMGCFPAVLFDNINVVMK
ncbi:MAG TPA: TldD/PmbA family protein [Exilispira sp.]|nr:TldD/PmbA family protein [Exilispira sp.]HQM89367.1 TldD/PmbA family protein [Exilispira sp.]HQQ19031.1 TldD/PmbA family protein [Exilispira sp.]